MELFRVPVGSLVRRALGFQTGELVTFACTFRSGARRGEHRPAASWNRAPAPASVSGPSSLEPGAGTASSPLWVRGRRPPSPVASLDRADAGAGADSLLQITRRSPRAPGPGFCPAGCAGRARAPGSVACRVAAARCCRRVGPWALRMAWQGRWSGASGSPGSPGASRGRRSPFLSFTPPCLMAPSPNCSGLCYTPTCVCACKYFMNSLTALPKN